MNRRFFLSSAGLGLSGLSPVSRAAMDCFVQRLPGVQLFTMRDALAADPDAALGQLAAAGIREVELYGLTGAPEIFGMSISAFRRLLDIHGLAMTFSHVDADALDIPALAKNANILGINTLILAMAPGFIQAGADGLRVQGPKTRQSMAELAELLNRLGLMFRREGLQFGYHNHHVEFFEVDGERPYNYVMANTDPQTVHCELDIGWMALARVNYLAYLDWLGPRVISCHMKDFDGASPVDMSDFLATADHLVPPGSGVVDWSAVLERMDYFDIRHGFLEIDRPRNALADLEQGHDHLRALRDCP